MQPTGVIPSRLLSILRGVQIRGSSLICINIAVLWNVYGHPHKETLKRLDDVSANVLTTSQYGAISIETRRGGGVRIRYYAPEISYD